MEEQAEEKQIILFKPTIAQEALAYFGMPPEKIESIKKKAEKLVVKDLDDKEGFRRLKKGVQAAKKYRTGLEKIRKALNDPVLDLKKTIDNEAKRLIGEIRAIEDQLIGRRDTHEKKLTEAKAEKYEKRLKRVMEAGYLFDGKYYVIGQIHLNPTAIENESDEDFETWIERASTEKERLEEFQITSTDTGEEVASDISAQINAAIIPEQPMTTKAPPPSDVVEVEVVQGSTPAVKSSEVVESDEDSGELRDVYTAGHEVCKRQVIFMINNPDYKKRSEIISAIESLKPPKGGEKIRRN